MRRAADCGPWPLFRWAYVPVELGARLSPGNCRCFYQGRRTRKITTAFAPQGAGTVIYTYDLYDRLKSELDGAGNPQRTYVWRDEVPVSIIEHRTPEAVWYLEVDHVNTPIAARDPTGKIIWRWEADAFGSTQPDEDPDGDTQTTAINLRYPGQYYDQESGLHYNHRRYYDPKLGRYMSPDPIGLAGGANLYGYVGGNPVSLTDPTGLQAAGGGGSGSGPCFDFNKFADQIEQNRSSTAADLAALASAEAVGTMPKTPGELRGLGVPKSELNPYTG